MSFRSVSRDVFVSGGKPDMVECKKIKDINFSYWKGMKQIVLCFERIYVLKDIMQIFPTSDTFSIKINILVIIRNLKKLF